MKKQLSFSIITLLLLSSASAKIITENDIGPCISRNAAGFCVESKTHYCSSLSKANGRCEVWFNKNKSQGANAVDYIQNVQNSMNESINRAAQKQAKLDKPYEDALSKEFPRLNDIANKKNELEKELANLRNKLNLGIAADKNKINLLVYQVSVLGELQNNIHRIQTFSGQTIRIVGSSQMERDYIDTMKALDNALKNNSISQEEYKEGKNNKNDEFRTNYNYLIDLYDKLLKLSAEPDYDYRGFVEENYNKNYSFGKFGNSNINNKVQKVNSHVNNGVNKINNTINGVNSLINKFGL